MHLLLFTDSQMFDILMVFASTGKVIKMQVNLHKQCSSSHLKKLYSKAYAEDKKIVFAMRQRPSTKIRYMVITFRRLDHTEKMLIIF